MKKLYRSETNKMLCGVCGGFAEFFGLDASLIRLGLAFFSLFFGAGILAYIIAVFVIPRERDVL